MKMKMTNCNKFILAILVITFISLVYIYNSNLSIETFYNLAACNDEKFKVYNLYDSESMIQESGDCISSFTEFSMQPKNCTDNYSDNAQDCISLYF